MGFVESKHCLSVLNWRLQPAISVALQDLKGGTGLLSSE